MAISEKNCGRELSGNQNLDRPKFTGAKMWIIDPSFFLIHKN